MTSGETNQDGNNAPTLEIGSDRAFDIRIEEELERVNIAVTEISQLSKQFQNVRASYQNLFDRAKTKCDKLYLANKKAVESTRRFYNAKAEAVKAKDEFIEAASRYRSACVHFEEMRENAATAEKAFMAQMSSVCEGTQDPVVLINLNKANEMVYEASKLKNQAFEDQERKMEALSNADHNVALLGSADSKTAIRALPYYEARDAFQKELDAELAKLKEHYILLKESKERYRSIFSKLHVISAEFEQRKGLASPHNDFSDLSKFEEIEDLQEDSNFEKDIMDTNYNLDVMSTDSTRSSALSSPCLLTSPSDNTNYGRNSATTPVTPHKTDSILERTSSLEDVVTFSDNLLEDDTPVAADYHGSLELQL